MRLSDLLDARVVDQADNQIGFVHDVRAEQDGKILGTWGAALTVKGLIVSSRHLSTLRYEAGHTEGPMLIKWLTRSARKQLRFVPWDSVVNIEDGIIHVSCAAEELAPAKSITQASTNHGY